MEKEICVITGANCGIGYEVARQMAPMGYTLILACRNPQRGNEAVAKLLRSFPQADISFMKLDLASKKSIEDFAKSYIESGKKLKILINNAGKLYYC